MADSSQSNSLPDYETNQFETSSNEEDVLGCGSYATVRKCTHKDLGKVVVKCFLSTGSDENCLKAKQEFQREAQVLAKLEHKNIIRVLGMTAWDNCVGIVLELIKNGNLEDLLMSQLDMAWSLRLQFTKEISDGLAYVHSKKVVHGDLKPQNILMGKNFTAKLADFGGTEIFKTTKAFDHNLKEKRNSQHTPIYAAPEYLKNLNQKKSTEMDVYSTAILIYEIITRHTAFSGVKQSLVTKLITENGLKPDEKFVNDVESKIMGSEEDLEIFTTLKNLMIQSWDHNPINRSTAIKMKEKLKSLWEKVNKPKLASITSQMLSQRQAARQKQGKEHIKCEKSPKVMLSMFTPPFRERTKSHESKFDIQEQKSNPRIRDQTSLEELQLLPSNHQEHLADFKKNSIEPQTQSSGPTIKEEIQKKINSIQNKIEQNSLVIASEQCKGLLKWLNNGDVHKSFLVEYKESDKVVIETLEKLINQGTTSKRNLKTKAEKCIKLIKLRVKFVAKVFSSKMQAEKLIDCAKVLWKIVKTFGCQFFVEVSPVMDEILIELQNTRNFDTKFVLLSRFYNIKGEISYSVDKKEVAISHIQKAIDILELDHNSTAENINTLHHFYDTLFNIKIELRDFDNATKTLQQFQNVLKRTKFDKTGEDYRNISIDVKRCLQNFKKSSRSSGVLGRIKALFSNFLNSIFR